MRWLLLTREHHSENGETQESASQIADESSYGPMVPHAAFLAVCIAATLSPSLHAYHLLAVLGAVGGVNSKQECSVDAKLIFQRLHKKTHQDAGYLIHIPLILREESLKTGDMSVQKETCVSDVCDAFSAIDHHHSPHVCLEVGEIG